MKALRLLIALVLAAVCGCATSYYHTKAVKKARDYAIKQMPEMSEKAMHVVRFTPPRMLQARLLAREGQAFDSKKDVMQTCMVWSNPDKEGTYIVVVGSGERRLDDWEPFRVLVRKFEDLEPAEKDKDAKSADGDFGGPSSK
jgi:hypothetical protein